MGHHEQEADMRSRLSKRFRRRSGPGIDHRQQGSQIQSGSYSGWGRCMKRLAYLSLTLCLGLLLAACGDSATTTVQSDSSTNGASSTTAQFDSQIAAANEQLKKDPQNTDALLKLAENEWFKAKTGVKQDASTGQASVSDDAHTALGASANAWANYLKLNQGTPNAGIAAEMVQVYALLNDATSAAVAQRIVAEHSPDQNSYGNLALYLYFAGDIKGGDAAAKKAVSLAPVSSKNQVQAELSKIRKQAVKLRKQKAKAQ